MNGWIQLKRLLLCASLSMVACAVPDGDRATPEGAYYAWVQARQKGDIDGCWEATHPEVRGYLERWNELERDTLFIIETIYPESRRAAALEILEEGGRARLPDGKALFAHLMTRGAGQPLEGLQALGARVSSTTSVDDETVTLTTRGGDMFTIKRVDEAWSFSLPQEQLTALSKLVDKAEANLARADANKKRLRGVD
ncbi:MAG: hypothetical protein ACPGU1_01120 [Myxococcota bacterium]